MEDSNLHSSPRPSVGREGEKKIVVHDEEHKSEKEEETGPLRTTEANPNARFNLINTKKDEGNFLFREKKYAAALERYLEALLELKVYRRCWRESRMLKMVVATATIVTTATQASEARACAQTNSLLGKRGLDKGKEKMDLEDEEAAAATAAEAVVVVPSESSKKQDCGGNMMVLEGSEEAMQEDSTRPIVPETSTCTPSTTTEDTMVDWDGLRRKRRRLDEAQCKGSTVADDDMTVEIIDKSDFAMPKDMKCSTSSSSSSTTTTTALGESGSIQLSSSSSSSTECVMESGRRSFKNLTECEKNLKRLEIIIRLNIAACGLRLGRGMQALEQCRKVVRINDLECCEPLLYAKALFRKAQSLKIIGANKEACATLRIALSFSPNDRAIRNELAALEQTMKKGSIVCKFFEKLRCRKQDNAEDQPQQPPSPLQEVSKSNKCKYFGSLFGGSCSAKTALSFLCRREISHRGLTRQQKVDIACRQLPKDPPATVDKYCRRAYGGQWSSDGELLLTTCQDWKIRIYANDSKTLSRKCVINAQKGQWTITDALMSNSKSFVLYSSITPHVHMVSLPEDLNNFESKGDHSVLNFIGAQGSDYSGIWCMALSADDREVLAGTSDSSLCVYDLERNQLVERAAAHGDDVNSVCYVDAENGVGSSAHLLASASDDGLIYMWDKRCMNDPVGVLFGHTEGLTCLTSKGDGRYLLSNSKDQTMKLWDLRKMVDRQHAQPPVKKYVWDYRGMSYPGQPGVDKHPHDLSVSTFQGHSVLRTLIRCRFTPAAWSGQRYACTASADGKVYIYDLSSTQLVRVYSATEDKGVMAGSSSAIVRDISWHPYLPYLVTTAWNGTVSLFSHEAKTDGEQQTAETMAKDRSA